MTCKESIILMMVHNLLHQLHLLRRMTRLFSKENHPFYKTDVYYYTDNRTGQIDVYYNAITLKLLGYKEKHKDYVTVNKGNLFLRINQSIRNRLTMIGFETKYIDINRILNKTVNSSKIQIKITILSWIV